MKCRHEFGDPGWPFPDPDNVRAYTTIRVLEEGHPILLVTHEADDGAWQVLCGSTDDPDHGRLACLGCLYLRDPSIGEVADLPEGWRAFRKDADSGWKVELNELEEEA